MSTKARVPSRIKPYIPTYPNLLENMKANGFDLNKTVLITDRGYESLHNIQTVINENLSYICAVPLTEKNVRDKFNKYWMSPQQLCISRR